MLALNTRNSSGKASKTETESNISARYTTVRYTVSHSMPNVTCELKTHSLDL